MAKTGYMIAVGEILPSELLREDVLSQAVLKVLKKSRSYKTAGMSIGNAAIEFEKRYRDDFKPFVEVAR